MIWTDERVETLTTLWQEGASASQIALKLGGVTRNAVIGKIHRLKISNEGRQARIGRQPGTAAAGAQPQALAGDRRRSLAKAGRAVAKIHSRQSPAGIEVAIERIVEKPFVPPMTAYFGSSAVMSMSDQTCKWPLGDPLAADFRFCCAPKGSDTTYCTHHARLAYDTGASRRAVRKAA